MVRGSFRPPRRAPDLGMMFKRQNFLPAGKLLVPSPRPRRRTHPLRSSPIGARWRSASHFCLERYWWLTRWELDFVATVARYTKPPSAKPLIILHRLVARCRNAAA